MGVNKSKPKGTSRLFEKKIEDAIIQAKKNVQNSQERIEKLKTTAESVRETIQEIRRKRRA
jgi:archaellum component FlaC